MSKKEQSTVCTNSFSNAQLKDLPKLIFFDYGNTLCSEMPYDGIKGYTAVLRAACDNPRGITPQKLLELSNSIYGKLMNDVHINHFEISHQCINKLLFDMCGIKFDISPVELEDIYWSNSIVPVPVPNIAELFDKLAELKIRTAIISNMSFSGDAMRKRIDRAIPNNRIEFIMSSGDYGFRKPNEEIFEAALGKAGLKPIDCVHCGDSIECDIIPASSLGMDAIWYTGCLSSKEINENKVSVRNKISDWSELLANFES